MKKYFPFFCLILLFTACSDKVKEAATPASYIPKALGTLPDWAQNANIYEVNIRQYTPEGSITAFQKHLPRLEKMGVDILWLMPIFPIGEVKRKGTMGSSYSVKDYKAVNPDYGTLEEFKILVEAIHALDMKIILDWVPNHTAWDHSWLSDHPDWYTYDHDTITHPLDPNSGNPTGWTDVADLNYDKPEMRSAMIDALKFWLTEADIDGYRCDVAGFVPNDFWKAAITALNQEKHVFMLAEWDNEPAHFDNGFQMNYSWEFKELIKEIAHGHKGVADVWSFYKSQEAKFPEQAIHLYFITNHDENSWNNYPAILGDAEKALAILAFTFDGMPLIYSGQESGLTDTLSFFHKDLIDWEGYQHADFYTRLLDLKHQNKALFNGIFGAKMKPIKLDNKNILAFSREKGNNRVEVYINLTKERQQSPLANPEAAVILELCSDKNVVGENALDLEAWGYCILGKGGSQSPDEAN